MSILVKEYPGEGELQLLVLAAVRDQGREIEPTPPYVPVLLDREVPYALLSRIPLPEPLQKRVHERRMPYHLPL